MRGCRIEYSSSRGKVFIESEENYESIDDVIMFMLRPLLLAWGFQEDNVDNSLNIHPSEVQKKE